MNDHILVHRWQNNTQQYEHAGTLIYDPTYLNGCVSFHYEEHYLKNGGGALEPATLPTNLAHNATAITSGNGLLPRYFSAMLPDLVSNTLLSQHDDEWRQLNQFERLSRLSEKFGDRTAIQLNSQLNQSEQVISDLDEVFHLLQTLTEQSNDEEVTSSLPQHWYMALTSFSGRKPKIDYTDPNSGQRYVIRPNFCSHYHEGKMRYTLHKLLNSAEILNIDTNKITLHDEELAIQSNFKHAFINQDNQNTLLKFNTVSFDMLINSYKAHQNGRLITYADAAKVIQTYSASVLEDLEQLYKRALVSALLNHTNNHLSNLNLIDLNNNHWRLAPMVDLLPNPGLEDTFALPFSDSEQGRSHFKISSQWAKRFARRLHLPSNIAATAYDKVASAIEMRSTLYKDTELDERSISTIEGVLSRSRPFSLHSHTQTNSHPRLS
jgi:hypothetical protein